MNLILVGIAVEKSGIIFRKNPASQYILKKSLVRPVHTLHTGLGGGESGQSNLLCQMLHSASRGQFWLNPEPIR